MLSEAVKNIPELRVFKLRGNRISEKGAEGVVEAVTRNGKVVDLGGNNIGRLGCTHLAKSLSAETSWL